MFWTVVSRYHWTVSVPLLLPLSNPTSVLLKVTLIRVPEPVNPTLTSFAAVAVMLSLVKVLLVPEERYTP